MKRDDLTKRQTQVYSVFLQKSPKLWNRKTGEPINLYFDSLMTPFLDAGTKKV